MRTKQLNNHRQRPADRRQRAQHADRALSNQNARVLWQRKHEHFTALAKTAATGGHAVDAENYYQHAEHYFRMIQGTAA